MFKVDGCDIEQVCCSVSSRELLARVTLYLSWWKKRRGTWCLYVNRYSRTTLILAGCGEFHPCHWRICIDPNQTGRRHQTYERTWDGSEATPETNAGLGKFEGDMRNRYEMSGKVDKITLVKKMEHSYARRGIKQKHPSLT